MSPYKVIAENDLIYTIKDAGGRCIHTDAWVWVRLAIHCTDALHYSFSFPPAVLHYLAEHHYPVFRTTSYPNYRSERRDLSNSISVENDFIFTKKITA